MEQVHVSLPIATTTMLRMRPPAHAPTHLLVAEACEGS